MKKMKKAAALMMTVAMMLSMAACGNSGAKETTGAAEGSDTQVASQAADGEEKTIYIYQIKQKFRMPLRRCVKFTLNLIQGLNSSASLHLIIMQRV